MNIEQELAKKLKMGVKKNEPLARYTSWQVGGPADYYLCPVDLDELILIMRFSKRYKLPVYVIGNGTNMLILDGGIRGLVLNIGDPFSYIHQHGENLVVGAGTPVTYLAREAGQKGLTGLEFAVGIPGSVGGAVIMNAGAFGGYIGDKVQSVKLVTTDVEFKTLAREELNFGYRTSNLSGQGVIYEVELALKKGDPAKAHEKMEHYITERKGRHPHLPSAGSVFRNLPDCPAGRLIDEAGGKGMRIGGAEVSQKHANFIVNTGKATAADILALIEAVIKLVKEKHDVELKPEVKVLGEERKQ